MPGECFVLIILYTECWNLAIEIEADFTHNAGFQVKEFFPEVVNLNFQLHLESNPSHM